MSSDDEPVAFILAPGAGAILLCAGELSPCEVRTFSPSPSEVRKTYGEFGNLPPPHLEVLALFMWVASNETLLKTLLDEFRHAVVTVDNEAMARIKLILGVSPVDLEKVN